MTDTRKRAAIYIRASSPEERTGLQFAEFAYIANRAGWHLAAHYKDIDDPGAQTGGERPQFDRMLRDAAQHKFDVLMTWSIERLGHSLQDLVTTLVQLQNAGVDLYLKEQAIDTTTAPGRALFQMAGIFAEAERAMRRERLRTGIARARQSGKRFGRPKIDSGRAGA